MSSNVYQGKIGIYGFGGKRMPSFNHDQELRKIGFAGEVERVRTIVSKGPEAGQMKDRHIRVTCRGFVAPGTQLGHNLQEVRANLLRAAANGMLLSYRDGYVCGIKAYTGYQIVKILTKAGMLDISALFCSPNAAAKKAFRLS